MKHILTGLLLSISLGLKSQDLSSLYERVNNSVVVILTEEKNITGQLGNFSKVSSQGLGSGFMISNERLITAEHVVGLAENIRVQFTDGEIIPAKVISAYKDADVALVELTWPKKNATYVSLGNSDDVKIGERVFVVGAPYGLAHSLSSGYISGKSNMSEGENPFTQREYFQTDAAINQGNSGGPMFNLKGEVIGVVSHILSKSGGFQGLGFAATSNLASELLLKNDILWSGIDVIPLRGELAKMFNIPQRSGLLVQRVVFLSNLGILGLRGGNVTANIGGKEMILGGDIILSINGIQFDLTDSTLKAIAKMATGVKATDPLTLKVLRAGEIVTLVRN